MRLVYDVANFKAGRQRLILALGNFDGLHIAHRKIIKRLKDKAVEKNLQSAVFILDPHPAKVLYPHKNFFFLSTLQERAEILRELGLDFLFIQKFTPEMARLSPLKFVQDYLVDQLQVAGVVVGFDYTFGAQGQGTADDLLQWGKMFDYQVEIVSPVMSGNEIISSSLIRDLLHRGEVKRAAECLGFRFTRQGKVVRGEGRGLKLGYPTANLDVTGDLILPARGVYFCLACWKNKKIFALTNIGVKPTFSTARQTTVEVFLLDFAQNIYGEELSIQFLCKIRNEIAFKDAESLSRQIAQDVECARELIKNKYVNFREKQFT
ncbi:MAG: bifunctional riboflavin kinase/FAD synthetase [Firmicutes bacterium]|mgnify:CR=1 FL=1|nr:bifunctional riboflavin kinase/FAD synthetase [Bacillota bacterium]